VLLKRGQEMPYPEDELPATLLSEDWGEPYKGGTAYQFKHELSCWLDIRGRARIWLIRAKAGRPPQWLRVIPEWAIVHEYPNGSLVVRRDAESMTYIEKTDILTINSFSPDGKPCSLVDVLRVTAGDIDYLRAKEELNQLERGFHQGLIG
jgi:hypothetical protein